MALLRILTLTLNALILVPSAAHLFELPGKIGLGQDAYFLVQDIYSGWSLFGIPIIVAMLANLGLSVMERRRDQGSSRWALASSILVSVSLGVFFLWVFPANQATQNWTSPAENWETLRRNWEYGHAVNALIVLAAFLATATATIRR